MTATRLMPALLLLTGCISSTLPPDIASTVPARARVVQLFSDSTPTAFYRMVYRGLAAQGYTVTTGNEAMGTLTTDFKDVGQETTLRITVLVTPTDSGSSAILRGHWGITATTAAAMSAGFGISVAGGSAEDADWGSSGRPKVAFGEMVIVARQIPHARIGYLTR